MEYQEAVQQEAEQGSEFSRAETMLQKRPHPTWHDVTVQGDIDPAESLEDRIRFFAQTTATNNVVGLACFLDQLDSKQRLSEFGNDVESATPSDREDFTGANKFARKKHDCPGGATVYDADQLHDLILRLAKGIALKGRKAFRSDPA
jgi:hypothetical protein